MNASPPIPYKELSVYARRLANGDVEIFRDEACTIPFCTFAHYRSDCPDMRNRYITLNCYSWRLRWVKGNTP